MRAPVSALLLTLLALSAPELTLAPAAPGEPAFRAATALGAPASWADSAVLVTPFRRVTPAAQDDRRTAGGTLPLPGETASIARPAPSPEPAVETTSAATVRAFGHALDAARARGEAHGVSFAVVRDGRLVWSGSSGRARDARTPLETDTPMVIGSLTKTFVAATVLQLADEGRLRLEDPVRRHLPELSQFSRRITIAQLLDHTSGLADVFNDDTRRGLETDPRHAWSADEVFATLHSPWYRPGEGWAYANTNYYLLGLIVERVSGAPLAEVLASRLTAPLGLDDTRLLTGAAGDPFEPAWATIFWASGAMAASAADVARWGDALYRGDVLADATRTAMLRFNDHDYGYGVQKIRAGKVKGYGHTGLLNTYTSLLFHVPRENVTMALLVNRSHVDLGAMLRAEPAGGPSLLELALNGR